MSRRSPTSLALVLPLLAACGGGDGPTSPEPDPDPDPTASSISISPGSATSSALEDTTEFSATVRDQDGNTMSGITVSWSSSDASVVSVSSSGEAVAEATGSADVIASAEGLADTASVTVDQAADQVDVTPAIDTLTTGDSLQLSASAADANGHPVADAEFAWSSSDEAVATVDSTGFVRTQSDGPVSVTAEIDGVSAASDLTVEPAGGPAPADAPMVSSVSPSPVPEGGTATISGSDFATTPDSNTVHVDGVETVVLSATSTSLEIDVPLYDCLPARDVFVAVETSAGADSASAGLEPDETPVQLAAGEGLLLTNPGDFCLQFDATSASERYVLGAQSTSRTVSSLTPVQLTAEAADGSVAALTEPMSLNNQLSDSRQSGDRPEMGEWLRAHRQMEANLRQRERQQLDRSDLVRSSERDGTVLRQSSVGSGVGVGDTVTLRVPDTSDGTSLCSDYEEIAAEVKAIGTRGIVLADTANPSDGFTDADYKDFSDRIDNQIFATQVEYFGQPSDIDGNDRVVALFTKELNRTVPNSLGFVVSTDLSEQSNCASSDEGEIFYGKVPDPSGTYGPAWSTSDALSQVPFIMAHELTHVIQFGRRLLSGKTWMNSWLAEAQATLSEEVVGHEVTGRSPGNNYGYATAFGEDADGIAWYSNAFVDLARYYGYESSTTRVQDAPDQCGWWRDDSSPCLARSLWYGVGWSFLRWLSDHYGASYVGGEADLHRAIVDADQDGWGTIEQVTGEDFDTLLASWSAALYVDDRAVGPEPELTIPSWDLVDVEQGLPSTARLVPFEAPFDDWVAVGEIRASSAGYVAVEGSGRPATAIRIRDGTDATLPAEMQIWLVRLE